MANLSQHRVAKRVCPGCQKERTYPVRQKFCNSKCRQQTEKRDTIAKLPESEEAIKGDTWAISLPRTRIHTLDALLEKFEVDLSEWTVDRFVVNKWDVGFTPREEDNASDGKNITELYQVKAWLKRVPHVGLIKRAVAIIIEEGKRKVRVIKPVRRQKLDVGYMLEMNIPDLHMGKLAWAPETGAANYDVKIAERCFVSAVDDLLEKTKAYRFEEIVFVLGNDLLHSDTKAGTTTAGTQLDNDVRYQKTFLITRKMIADAIEHRLLPVAPVRIIVVPGNHDELGAWHMGALLETQFAKCPDVKIDNSPNPRKYYQYGKVMLMFAHGHKGKLPNYPQEMAAQQPKMWGDTLYREAHTGDKHQTRLIEQNGVRVRILPALCPPDYWHHENFFTGQIRSAEAYIWHREQGLVGTAIHNIKEEKVA